MTFPLMIAKHSRHLLSVSNLPSVIQSPYACGRIESVYVSKQALLQLIKSRVIASVSFFFLQIFEKALHNSVVIRMTFSRKRLDDIQ